MNDKTQIRIKLDKIEDEIKQMCFKDLNKTDAIKNLNEIIKTICKEDSLENYFSNNASDVNYFVTQFSCESLLNLTKKSFIPGNGDDAVLELFLSYISLFITYQSKNSYLFLWETIKEIFIFNKPFYQPNLSKNLNKQEIHSLSFAKKMMSCEEYNKKIIVLSNEFKINNQFLIGEIVDVKIIQPKELFCKSNNAIIDKILWTRGLLVDQDSNLYKINIPGESNLVEIEKDSINIAKEGTLTLDYDWRVNLNEGDNVSCFDNNIYYASTIIQKKRVDYDGMPQISYLIGYRIYLHEHPNWEDYTCYLEREITKDQNGRKYIGFSENDDELISFNSKRIQKLSFVKQKYNPEDYYIDQFIPYINNDDKSINYVVGRETIFSYYYAQLVTKFLQMNGFGQFLNFIQEKTITSESLVIILQIIKSISPCLHIEVIKQYSSLVKRILSDYLINIKGNDLRNLKKEAIDLIVDILNLYMSIGKKEPIELNYSVFFII